MTAGRYFPEVVDAVCALGSERFVLDGDLVVAGRRDLGVQILGEGKRPVVVAQLRVAEREIKNSAKKDETPRAPLTHVNGSDAIAVP